MGDSTDVRPVKKASTFSLGRQWVLSAACLEEDEFGELGEIEDAKLDSDDRPPVGARLRSEFRGALEYNNPEQREKEREAAEKREKNRLSKLDEAWASPLRWLTSDQSAHASPETDGEGWSSYFPDFLKPGEKEKGKEKARADDQVADGEQTEDRAAERGRGGHDALKLLVHGALTVAGHDLRSRMRVSESLST